jgi:membrane protease YdiL (CAAX protease family)
MDNKSKKFLYIILFGGELFLFFVAFIILIIKKQSFISIFTAHQNFNIILLFYLMFLSFLIALIITFLVIKLNIFTDIKKIIKEIITNFNLNIFDIFIISAMAGFCEEILFRGVLQPMLGIWLTSFIFILLHGYFNPVNWRISVFGILMFWLSMILGFIYVNLGLSAAIIFHISYDFFAFLLFKNLQKNLYL